MLKACHKRLKAALALGVRKLGPVSLLLKLGEFLLFDSFLDLAEFLPFEFPNLYDFKPFENFPDFLASSSLPSPTPNSTISALSFPTSGLDISDDPVVFSIEMSEVVILPKPWMNCK